MPAPIPLSGRQKRFLRSMAQRVEPLVWVGDAGLTEGVARALREALVAHELVKVRMRAPEDKKALAAALAEASESTLVSVIGHTAILFRANPDEPTIELPARGEA
jgi:RNA-binding protein